MLAPDGRRLGPNEIFFMLARDRRAFFYAGHEKHFLLIRTTKIAAPQGRLSGNRFAFEIKDFYRHRSKNDIMSISVEDSVDDLAAIRCIFAWSVILHEKPPNLLKTQRIDGFLTR